MKHLFTFIFIISTVGALSAQDEKWPAVDASTLDMIYYPQEVAWRNYLGDDQRNITPKIKLVYSRPAKKGRDIWGGLIPYGEEWRLGANEATTITFYAPVSLGGETIPAGAYTMSALVEKDHWTLNFSSESGIWGNANRDNDLTVASFRVKVKEVDDPREELSMTFQEVDDRNINLAIEWDGRRVLLPIGLNPAIFSNVDKSPLDMAHYPRTSAFTNYMEGDAKNVKPKIQVTYSRPLKNDRVIFGELLKEGEVWRMGANEATEIVLYEDASVNGTKIAKGRYALFARTNANTWDIIFSKDYPIWGAYGRDESKDAATVSVPVEKGEEVLEALSIMFKENGEEVHMHIGWDQTSVVIPFVFSKEAD